MNPPQELFGRWRGSIWASSNEWNAFVFSSALTSLLKKLLLLHLCLLLNWGERETGRGFFLFSACYCNTDKETLLFTTLFNRRAVRVFRNYYLMTNATKISTLKRTTTGLSPKYVFINQMITISLNCVLNSARKKIKQQSSSHK